MAVWIELNAKQFVQLFAGYLAELLNQSDTIQVTIDFAQKFKVEVQSTWG
jgi:hypothetical protein